MMSQRVIIVTTIYITIVSGATIKSAHSYANEEINELSILAGKTLQKLDENSVESGLQKFPGIHSNLRHHIDTYKILSEKPLEELDRTKVNTLINLQEIIYSMLSVEPERDQQPELQVQLGFKCPKRADIQPCTCTSWDKPTLNCSDVKSFVTLKQILNTAEFPSTKFTLFTYYPKTTNEEEAVLLNNTFGPLSFKQIFIGQSGLIKMEPNALDGSQATLELFMSDGNRKLESFPFDTLSCYKKLSTLTIVKSSIDKIPLLSSPSLKYLDLNSNKISKLRHDVFATLPSLTMTDLSYNKIENISPNGLYMTSPNSIIYLNRNQLRDISPFGCYQPFLLDESHNFLTTFREDVYKPILDRMAYVDVSSNNIDCSELQWVAQEPEYQPYIISDCFK